MQQNYFFLGMIAMQVIFLLYHFILFKKKEFLYFLLFVLGVTAFVVLLSDPQNNKLYTVWGIRKLNTLAFGILIIVSGTYYKFTCYFINAPVNHPRYNKIMTFAEMFSYITGLIFMINFFFSDSVGFVFILGKLFFLLNIPLQAYLIFYLFKSRNRLNYMLLAASLFMTLFFKMAIVPIAFHSIIKLNFHYQLNAMFIGLVFHFMFFNFILIYKSRLNEKQKLALEYQKKQALELQRREISNDLHDDLGSILSSIQTYANIATKKFEEGSDKTLYYLQKISGSIKIAMDNIGDVIWAIRNDEIEEKSFSSRIKDFFFDVFDARNIECLYDIDPETEKAITGVMSRKYLILIAKEAINNAVKHSQASQLIVRLKTIDDQIYMAIEDNGIGIDDTNVNMNGSFISLKDRASKLNGIISLKNKNGSGTVVEFYSSITIIREK